MDQTLDDPRFDRGEGVAMNSRELMEKLFDGCQGAPHDYSDTCDTLKCGDAEREIHKVAVTMFPTPEVIRAVHRWGADLLIVHEPTFYHHYEVKAENDPVIEAKEKLLAETGLVVWRFHDHPHVKAFDMICDGELAYLGLEGEWLGKVRFAVNRYRLRKPMTPREIARLIEEKLHIAHVRICGAADAPCTKLALGFGSPGSMAQQLRDPEVEVAIAGEVCEWQDCEYARDASQLGFRKALLVLGHAGSERDGMRLLTERMKKAFPDLETRYFECGEAYTYSEIPPTGNETALPR